MFDEVADKNTLARFTDITKAQTARFLTLENANNRMKARRHFATKAHVQKQKQSAYEL